MKRLILLFLSILMLAGMAHADESILTVSGSGTVYLEADCAYASLGVNMDGQDLTTLQKQVNETVNAIYAALLEAGLETEDISTARLYINPVYDYQYESASFSGYSEPKSKIVGYTIDHALSIRANKIERLGAYIDAAFAAGANSFDSIYFTAQNDADAKQKALELAVNNAREKAETIAAASGRQLGDIVEITEGAAANYGYANATGARFAMEETASYDVSTTVRASQVEVGASVQITYELK